MRSCSAWFFSLEHSQDEKLQDKFQYITTIMCNRRSLKHKMSDIEYYYSAQYSEEVEGMSEADGHWEPAYHINAFDFSPAPVITSRHPGKIQLMNWGLIPHRTKSLEDALRVRTQTIMARTEEMYEKFSYAELVKAGKRCLIPTSGYFEHRWLDEKGKDKIPYYIFIKDRPIFSIAGIYSRWTDPNTGKNYLTYTVCTTRANELAATIHNSGMRMPVILASREAELEWLNPNLSKEAVLKLCEPINSSLMDAYTISKLITSKQPNVAEALEPFSYSQFTTKRLFDQE
jgi:putative SOS response-associated peptidase YedK